MRNILLVSNMYPSGDQIIYGVFIKNIENALQKNGCNVSLQVIAGRGRTLFEKIKKYIGFYIKIFQTDLSAYDVVDISYPSHSFLPFFFKKSQKTNLVVRLHGHDLVATAEETISFKILRWITLKACRRADGIVVPSPFFERELLRLAPEIKAEIVAIPSGSVDPTVFYPERKDMANGKPLCFGYVGRLDRGKGVDLFIRAFANLKFDSRAIIVGAGPLMDEIKGLIKDLELQERCQVVGPVLYQNLPYFYNQFDLFVFPTLYRESFGSVMLEAMACGVPVLASDHGAPADFIAEGIDGFKVRPGNINQIAAAMERFSTLKLDERENLRHNAIKKSHQYQSDRVINRYHAFLEKLEINNGSEVGR